MVALNDVSGSTVTAGSGTIQRKIAIPDNAANMEPQEILIAAMELDLSQYGNTQQFIEKMEALKLLCEEAVAISQLKDAMGNLSYTDSNNLLPNRWYDPTKTVSSTNMSDSTTYSDELPAGADLGANYAVVTGLGDVSYLDQQQSIIMEFKNGSNGSYEGKDRTPYDVSSASDVSFWIKFDNMTKDAYIRIKVLGHNSGGANLIPESVTVPMSKSGEWFKISLKEITGVDWNKGLSNGLFRVLVGLNDATGSTVTIGSGFVDVKAINIAGEANWSLADWIYEAMKIDYQQYVGADEFKAALDYAVDVRDRLQISRSSNVTEYDTHALADADKATVIGTNCLETIVPAIYHSADGNTKNEVSSAAPELFTDGDNTTVGVVSGLDNTNEASFTQFVYKFKGEARISDFFIYNDNANIADKYYIYMSDSESDLFLQENLLVPFTNVEGKSVQRFNFEGKPEVKGNYIGIRVYSDSHTVSFAEFAAYGEVITYDVEKGNFTNSQIANIGDNLLKDVVAKAKTTIKFDWQGFLGVWANQYHYSKLTDNNTSTPVAIYANNVIVNKDDTISVHIYYDLGTTYTIDKLFLNHWDNKGLETGKYEIYASKDINSLFMSRSMVLSYDNTVDGPNGTTLSQLFTLKNEVVARFVSFRITYPISDWDYCETRSDYGKLYGIRLSELGVYGTEWVKPYALVNLTSHVPMDVYRTDANGKQTKVDESEYSGSEHKYTYDGNDATVADIKIKNGEKLDFVYNLAAEMTLEEICMKLGVGSVKKMNIYASTVKDSIWDSSSLIYSANDALGETYFGKGYAGSPIKARYIRFEILENEGEDLIINELEAIGGNDQEFNYMNLIEEKPESASFYLQDKDTGLFAGTT
ncbi:MAG: hypothetical protein IJN15_02965, partial [Clostridia bacterium]|nr:hypothetical protein [Clostridia bacterium]